MEMSAQSRYLQLFLVYKDLSSISAGLFFVGIIKDAWSPNFGSQFLSVLDADLGVLVASFFLVGLWDDRGNRCGFFIFVQGDKGQMSGSGDYFSISGGVFSYDPDADLHGSSSDIID
jgi:hypothetical protein